jgi:iron complex outermembrane recepter protein
MRNSFILIATLLVTGITTFAQTGSIKGKITNKDGDGIQFVNIILKNSKQGTTSNEDGEFLLKNVKIGNQTIITQFVGLKSVEQNINVSENQTIMTAFQMLEATNEL